jgi:ribulose-5-phosphate 4-epimerase/fuculose-1-phosphate aldolase
MNIATPPSAVTTRPDHIHEAEWEARVELAACYRLVAHFGMTDLVYNHITSRVPEEAAGGKHQVLINEFGLHYTEITASSLIKIDLDGTIVDEAALDRGARINPAGYVIHGCVHAARDDVRSVLHTHSRAGIAVSCMADGLIVMDQEGYQFYEQVAYHDYEGQALGLDEQKRLVADLGDSYALILRNHGLLTCGRSVPEAFRYIYYLEMACKVQVDVLASGQKIIQPSEEVRRHTYNQWHQDDAGTRLDNYGTLEWPALVRMMERKDPSFLN